MNCITDLNEMIVFILMGLKIWKDEFLVWNVTEYGGISVLTFPVEDVWIPDVNIANRYISNYKLDLCICYQIIWQILTAVSISTYTNSRYVLSITSNGFSAIFLWYFVQFFS